jgi:hypothetical protein
MDTSDAHWLAPQKKRESQKPSSFVQNAAQLTSSGLQDCLNCGHFGSVETVVTVAHLF